MRRRSIGGAAILMVLAAAWFAWLGPRELGGPAAYVIAEGNSMEPGIHAGDLVVTRRAASYGPGDVVAYENGDLGRWVMHRIVDRVDGRFVLQGDNNDWLDSYRPAIDEVIGRQRLRVPYVGTVVMAMRSFFPLVALGAALLVGGVLSSRTGRRDRAPATPGAPRPAPAGAPAWWAALPPPGTAWGVAALLALAAAALFALPATRSATTDETYRQQGRFGYQAVTDAGPVYIDGVAGTGDPVYLRLADSVDLSFDYRFDGTNGADSPDAREVAGSARLDLVVSERNGWSRRYQLQGETPFDGRSVTLGGTVDLAVLTAQLDSVEEATGWNPGVYRLTVAPVVEVDSVVAGRPVSDRFAPTLALDLDDVSLRPVAPTDAEAGDPFAPAGEGTVAVPTDVARTVPVIGLPVGTARGVAAIAAVVALGVALAATRGERPRRRLSPSSPIELHRRDWLVEGRLPDEAEHGVELGDFEVLRAFADAAGAPIIHESLPGHGDVYGTRADGVWYWYEVVDLGDPRRAAEDWMDVTASIPWNEPVSEPAGADARRPRPSYPGGMLRAGHA